MQVLNQNKSVNLLSISQKKELNMKKLLGLCAGALLMMPFTLQAENSPTGPFVECQLQNGNVEFMPAMFCEIKKGKYHY